MYLSLHFTLDIAINKIRKKGFYDDTANSFLFRNRTLPQLY